MAIELKKVGDIQTLALGYTHEASFDASELSASTGSQTTAVQVAWCTRRVSQNTATHDT